MASGEELDVLKETRGRRLATSDEQNQHARARGPGRDIEIEIQSRCMRLDALVLRKRKVLKAELRAITDDSIR